MSDASDHQDLRAKLNLLREVLKANEIRDFQDVPATEALRNETVFRPARKAESKVKIPEFP